MKNVIKWVDLDEARYAQSVREGRPGLAPAESGLSIYEVPSRIGIAYDRENPVELCVIFEYISHEPEVLQNVSETLRVSLGAHSRRLRKAYVNIRSLLNPERPPNPTALMDFVTGQIVGFLSSANYSAAKADLRRDLATRVIRDNKASVSSALYEGALAAS